MGFRCFRCLEKLVLLSILKLNTSLSSFIMWNFRGSKHTPTPPPYFEWGVTTPSDPHDLRPWYSVLFRSQVRRVCVRRCRRWTGWTSTTAAALCASTSPGWARSTYATTTRRAATSPTRHCPPATSPSRHSASPSWDTAPVRSPLSLSHTYLVIIYLAISKQVSKYMIDVIYIAPTFKELRCMHGDKGR